MKGKGQSCLCALQDWTETVCEVFMSISISNQLEIICEVFMQPIKPVNSIHQSAQLRYNTSRIPILPSEPCRDSNLPLNEVPESRVTQFSDPRDPHLFLIPPHDKQQPDLEADSERGVLKALTFYGCRGYQNVADLLPDIGMRLLK